jgi:hypothetical protein
MVFVGLQRVTLVALCTCAACWPRQHVEWPYTLMLGSDDNAMHLMRALVPLSY